ncbi:hypothetical protein B0T26DRAFT_633179 [Lasiosphaeria miniovina]|uniref:FAD/NAD(P)-binding domain-containing protein n=1 Tax=Lasiosphaeria miniovina TaxID=1954250 RepID=A0AA40BEY5_9PEZI|nr:uncharacterized protein B0T26DRAFT_633179 [Lasiosphaeria miniovina]KAK0732987.1 hypothetical protein B0T26DRAFT_633179 [Lasiosphaeria miniovina]
MAEPKKHIVVLGASYAGLSTAHYVLKHVLPRRPDSGGYDVVLVSASAEAMCRPACPRALIADRFFPQDKLFVSVAAQFAAYPPSQFRFVHGRATALDRRGRTTETISFHALVIATGASTPSPLLGFNDGPSDALRAHWAAFRTALPTARSIVIAGGGPAGVEVAGELGEHLNGSSGGGWKAWWPLGSSKPPPRVAITLVTSAPELLPALPPAIARAAEAQLARLGVRVVKNTRVTAVSFTASPSPSSGNATSDPDPDPDPLTSNAAVALASGAVLHADLYIPCVGTTPNTAFLSSSGLLAADGRVATESSTLRISSAQPSERLYAIGDASDYARRPAVHAVLAAVPVLCANLRRDLLLPLVGEGKGQEGDDAMFREDTRATQLVPLGTRTGVGAVMGYRLPGFAVWLIKGRDYWLWTTGRLWSGRQWAKES